MQHGLRSIRLCAVHWPGDHHRWLGGRYPGTFRLSGMPSGWSCRSFAVWCDRYFHCSFDCVGSVAISGCRAPLADPPPGVPKRRACSRPPSGTSGTARAARRTQCRVAWLAPRPTPPPGKSPARSTSRWHYHRRTTIRCDGHSPSRAAEDRGYPTRTPGRPASTSRRPLQHPVHRTRVTTNLGLWERNAIYGRNANVWRLGRCALSK